MSPHPSTEVANLVVIGQLSPICRSPRSKGTSVRRVTTGEGGRTKRFQEGRSGSMKRLFSPTEESHHAKRQRIVLSPKNSNLKLKKPPIGPLKTTRFSSDLSEGHSRIFSTGRNETIPLKPVSCQSLGEQGTHQEVRDENQRGSGFTVITEQEATQAKTGVNLCADKEASSPSAHVHEPAALIVPSAPQRNTNERDADTNQTQATRTAMTSSNGDKVTSSDQEQASGILIKLRFCLPLATCFVHK